MTNPKNWPPRFTVDPVGGVKLLLAMVRDGHRTIDEVAPFLMFKSESQDEPPAERTCRCDSAKADLCSGGDMMTLCRCECHSPPNRPAEPPPIDNDHVAEGCEKFGDRNDRS